MTDTTTEAPTLTPVLVRNAIYSRYGVLYIANTDDTMVGLVSNETIRDVVPSNVTLEAAPGSDEWVDRMVRVRNSLASDLEITRSDLHARNRHLDALGQALLGEAVQRGWCEEYDEFARNWDLPQRKVTYEVTMTVRVTAVTDDEAVTIVRDGVSLSSYDENVSEEPFFSAAER